MGVIPHTPGEYPKYLYHAKKAPVLVTTKEEHIERRRQGFVDTYLPQRYPMHMHKNQHTRTVKNEAEEKAFAARGWKTTEHLQKAAAKGEGHKHHQLHANPDGTMVPEDEAWIQSAAEEGLDDFLDEDPDDEGQLEPEPEPVMPRPRKKRPTAPKKKGEGTEAAGE